ncbi:unnamed protein product [Camellia sinensis]
MEGNSKIGLSFDMIDSVVQSLCTWAGLFFIYIYIYEFLIFIYYVCVFKHMGPQLLVSPRGYLLFCFKLEPISTWGRSIWWLVFYIGGLNFSFVCHTIHTQLYDSFPYSPPTQPNTLSPHFASTAQTFFFIKFMVHSLFPTFVIVYIYFLIYFSLFKSIFIISFFIFLSHYF